MKTKKVYIAPVAEIHGVKLGKCLLGDASLEIKATPISGEEAGFEKGANTRQVHEDGLRDWNIDLW